MNLKYNRTFKQFLLNFNLPEDLSFSVKFPNEVQEILADQVLINEYGITLKSNGELGKLSEQWQNYSIMEDFENHFHVDSYIHPPDNKKIFMLGVKTLISLAEKFHDEKIKGVRFWYWFQTPELGELWAKEMKLQEDNAEYFLGDRLSFHFRRKAEDVVGFRINEKSYWARMIIDI
jgi:hypothetical protein